MLTIAFCQDSTLARTERQRQFTPHMEHLRSIMPSIRLAAPLATADGAAISNDDRLVASVFALETTTLLSAKELMSADPYTAFGIWSTVSLFTPSEMFGEWLAPADARNVAPGGIYVSFTTASQNEVASKRLAGSLFGANVKFADSIGDPPVGANRWRSVTFMTAASLTDAKAAAVAATRPETTQVWAIPLAVGAWPGKTDL